MFSNYRPGVQTNSCNCHQDDLMQPVEQNGPVQVMKDEHGNIVRLQWSPNARFTLNLTSDINIPVESGSKIFTVSGMSPLGITGWEGLLAYNTVDVKCWKYTGNRWIELPEIISCPGSDVIISLSNDSATTRVSIKNFRGESIFSDDNKGSFIPLTVDDTLAKILMQGFYHVDIYQLSTNSTKLIRRIPLSIGYSAPPVKPPIHNQGCHSGNTGFATDNTLSLKNGVLSVNTSQVIQMGGTLPVSSGAVFEYAQPRNLIVDVDVDTKQASVGSYDIYNYIMSGGDVLCLIDGLYLEFINGSAEKVAFKTILLDDNKIISHIVFINSTGSVEYEVNENHINSSADITQLQTTILSRMDALDVEHDTDIQNMNASIESMQESVSKMQNQIGDLKVTDKIVELYNNYNQLNVTIQEVDKELESKISEVEVSNIVNQTVNNQLTDERLQIMINNAVADNLRLDGGVVE